MLLKDVRYFRQRKIGIELNVCERARVKNIQGPNMCRSSLRLYSSSCVGHFVQEMPELSQWSLLLERPSDLPVPVNPGKDPTVWCITHCTPQHYHYGVETRQFIHAEHLYCLCHVTFLLMKLFPVSSWTGSYKISYCSQVLCCLQGPGCSC